MSRRPFTLSGSGPTLVRAIVAICVFALMAACGGNQGSPTSSSPAPSSPGTGSLSFTVEWEPPPASYSPSIGKGASARPLAPAINVCTDYGIANVTMQVLAGQTVKAEASVPCENHTATLSNVPADNNLTLHVTGSVQGAGIVWNGYSAPFKLAPSEDKNVGKITMSYTGNDTTPPTVAVASVTPADNATNVPENAPIQFAFSEPMAVNTVIDNGSFIVLDNASRRVPGVFVPTPPPSGTSAFLFQSATPLSSGTRYTVTIDNDFITDMAGNALGSPYSFGFFTRFRGKWGIPAKIESDEYTTGNSNPPFLDVALNEQGDAFAVWQETHIGPMYVYATRYNSAKNQWEPSVNISPSTANYCWSERVVSDGIGNAIAVWIQEYWYIVANRYAGGNWTGPVTFNNRAVQGDGSNPVIAMDNSGDAYVSYVARDANRQEKVYVSNFSSASGQWNLNFYSTGENCQGTIGTQKIAMKQGAKNYLLLYSCDNGAIFYDDSPSPVQIGVGTLRDLASRKSKAVAVWDNTDGLWSSFFDSIKYPYKWTAPVQITMQIPNGGWFPSVAMNDNGDIIAIWGGGDDNVYVSHATFAVKQWGPPINLSGTATGDTTKKLGIDRYGNAMAVWLQRGVDDYYGTFLSKKYNSGTTTWDANAEDISQNNMNRLNYPSFSMNDGGNAVAAWLLWEGNGIPPNVHANFWYK